MKNRLLLSVILLMLLCINSFAQESSEVQEDLTSIYVERIIENNQCQVLEEKLYRKYRGFYFEFSPYLYRYDLTESKSWGDHKIAIGGMINPFIGIGLGVGIVELNSVLIFGHHSNSLIDIAKESEPKCFINLRGFFGIPYDVKSSQYTLKTLKRMGHRFNPFWSIDCGIADVKSQKRFFINPMINIAYRSLYIGMGYYYGNKHKTYVYNDATDRSKTYQQNSHSVSINIGLIFN